MKVRLESAGVSVISLDPWGEQRKEVIYLYIYRPRLDYFK